MQRGKEGTNYLSNIGSGGNENRSQDKLVDESDTGSFGFALGVLVPICLLSFLALWIFYAYRNPHTKSGQLLIQVTILLYFSNKRHQDEHEYILNVDIPINVWNRYFYLYDFGNHVFASINFSTTIFSAKQKPNKPSDAPHIICYMLF